MLIICYAKDMLSLFSKSLPSSDSNRISSLAGQKVILGSSLNVIAFAVLTLPSSLFNGMFLEFHEFELAYINDIELQYMLNIC